MCPGILRHDLLQNAVCLAKCKIRSPWRLMLQKLQKKVADHDWDDKVAKVFVNTIRKIDCRNSASVDQPTVIGWSETCGLGIPLVGHIILLPCLVLTGTLQCHRGQGQQQKKQYPLNITRIHVLNYLTNCVFQQSGRLPNYLLLCIILSFFSFHISNSYRKKKKTYTPRSVESHQSLSLAASRRTSGTESFKAACVAGIVES